MHSGAKGLRVQAASPQGGSSQTRAEFSVMSIGLMLTLLMHAGVLHGRDARIWTPPAISSDQYEATPTFTPDGREMYFMLADARFQRYRLMQSRCEHGNWSKPAPASFAVPGVQEGDPGITPDGKRLYFISMRNDPAKEDFDIWFVERQGADAWSTPQRLPAPVNSSSSELLPRADRDGRLYFGSDRAGGLGQGDIYVASQNAAGKWAVENVGPPVSTAAYEYEAEISQDGRTLIAVIDRGDRSRLYRFEQLDGRWIERGRITALEHVFQVGPLLSPDARRLLFSQADGTRSGELFLMDLVEGADERWPACSR